MKRLLSIEFLKLKTNRTFKVFIILYFAIVLGLALLSYVKIEFGPFKFDMGSEGAFTFPVTWQFITYIASYLKLFLDIILVTNIVNEYDFRTLKQNLIDGMSKQEFMLSKILTMTTLSLISTVLLFIAIVFLGVRFTDKLNFSVFLNESYYLPVYFLSMVSFLSIMMFISIIIRKSAFAFGLLFVWSIVESIIKTSLGSKLGKGAFNLGNYLPIQAIGNLIHEPFTRLKTVRSITNMATQGTAQFDYSVHFSTVTICLFYTILFLYLSYFIIKKRDL